MRKKGRHESKVMCNLEAKVDLSKSLPFNSWSVLKTHTVLFKYYIWLLPSLKQRYNQNETGDKTELVVRLISVSIIFNCTWRHW